MQVLEGLTQILIWGSEIAQGPTRKIKGTWSFGIKGGPKILGGTYEPHWCHAQASPYSVVTLQTFKFLPHSPVADTEGQAWYISKLWISSTRLLHAIWENQEYPNQIIK